MTTKTKLDRTILSILPEPDSTPSSRSGISCSVERLHRLHGVSLMYDAVATLTDDDKPTTANYTLFPTAAILFHRFFHRVSLRVVDVWSTAMACTVLAAKLGHHQQTSVRDVIAAFQYVLRQRGGGGTAYTNTTRTIDRVWHERLVATEGRILRELGFVVYWIPEDANPHPYIGPFCEYALKRTNEASVVTVMMKEAAHKHCNTALHLDLSVRFAPTAIACAAVWVAISIQGDGDSDSQQQQYFIHPHALCSALCGPEKREAVLSIANGILGMRDASNNEVNQVRNGYLASLCEEGSFNGPDTPSWDCLIGKARDD